MENDVERGLLVQHWRMADLRRAAGDWIPLLSDKLIPALAFGIMATAKCMLLLLRIRRGPADATFETWSLHSLQVAHDAIAVLFFGLVATLFLIRDTPRGTRPGAIPTTVALLGTFILNLLAFHPPTLHSREILLISNVLLIAGLAFTIYAAICLGRCFGIAPAARGLMTSGAYRLVRHPLYLGEFVAFLGLLLPVLSPVSVAIFGTFAVLQYLRMTFEERVLTATFHDYTDYRLRTPAIIPWPRPR